MIYMGTELQLVGLTGTVNALVSLFLAALIYRSYKKSHAKSHSSFFYFFLFFGIFYLTFATAQLVLWYDSGLWIGIFHVISYFFLYLALGYLLCVPLYLSGKSDLANALWVIIFVLNVLFLIERIIEFTPSEKIVLNSYVYWQPIFAPWVRVLTGIMASLTAASVSLFFLRHGYQHRNDKKVYHRSIWLSLGIGILMMAAILAFIAAPSGSAPFVFVATFMVLLGLLITHRGLIV